MADLQRVRRILLSLQATKESLRQYPRLAVKVSAALEKSEKPAVTGR